jgi:hypothetical protein
VVYSLVLTKRAEEGARDFGENIFYDQLSQKYSVYFFYYPGPIINPDLEKSLKSFGDGAGKNLLVNIGRLNDPKFNQIVSTFKIRTFPVVIVTGMDSLASMKTDNYYSTTYVRLDNKDLLKNVDKTIECLGELFNLFISGQVSAAINQANHDQRSASLSVLRTKIFSALTKIVSALNEKDISVSLLEGKFEIKNRAEASHG